MMAFLEVLHDRLLPQVAKTLNPLQRWRHKQDVKAHNTAVYAALEREWKEPDVRMWKNFTGKSDAHNYGSFSSTTNFIKSVHF